MQKAILLAQMILISHITHICILFSKKTRLKIFEFLGFSNSIIFTNHLCFIKTDCNPRSRAIFKIDVEIKMRKKDFMLCFSYFLREKEIKLAPNCIKNCCMKCCIQCYQVILLNFKHVFSQKWIISQVSSENITHGI